MIELATERIKDYDTKRREEMETLKQQVTDSAKALEERRRRHASRTAYHGGKLPVEIFGEIFGLLVAHDVTQAIVVSHVCKHWRAMALSTPSLWKTLILAKKDPARKTREWIKRSQSRIRELCVRVQFKDSIVPLTSALLGFPWNHLRVCRVYHAASFEINQILVAISATNILANLVELEDVGWLGKESMVHFNCRIFGSQLRSLIIENQVVSWDDLSGLTKLVSLVVRNSFASPAGCVLYVLEANPMLEKVVLDTIVPHGHPLVPLALTLPRLTHLEIARSPTQNFSSITMPSLQILRLSHVISGADELLGSILDRGPVMLTELRIQSSVITSSKLIPFLRAASSLETFVLSHFDGQVNTIVEALASYPSPSQGVPSPFETFMCPLLAHINLSACPGLKTGAIMRFVKSRLPSVAPETSQHTTIVDKNVSTVAQIETLMLNNCPMIEPEVLPWLRSRVQTVSCVYATGKDAKWKR
jgi:F-box/TPR repeat protein Pof3